MIKKIVYSVIGILLTLELLHLILKPSKEDSEFQKYFQDSHENRSFEVEDVLDEYESEH